MYNVFEKQENMEVRNAQIVYLAEVCGMTASEIAKFVDLAVSTIRGYIKKFSNLLEKAKQWFGNQGKKVVEKIKEKCNVTDLVTFENCVPKKGDCAYIIEYFDSQHNFLFLKVGMTNDIIRRTKEHLKYYCKSTRENPNGWDATYAIVKELHFAEDEEDALTLENLFRKHYKNIPDSGFIKRDRFSFVRYNKEELQNDKDLQNKVQIFEKSA